MGIKCQMPGKQDGCDIGHAHGHAGVATVRAFNRIHGQRADTIGKRGEGGKIGDHRVDNFT
jgi:hypothetical protein